MSSKDDPFYVASPPTVEFANLEVKPNEIEKVETTAGDSDMDSTKQKRTKHLNRIMDSLLLKISQEERIVDLDITQYLNLLSGAFGPASYSHVLPSTVLCQMRPIRPLLALDVVVTLSMIMYDSYVEFGKRMTFLKQLTQNAPKLMYEIEQ